MCLNTEVEKDKHAGMVQQCLAPSDEYKGTLACEDLCSLNSPSQHRAIALRLFGQFL